MVATTGSITTYNNDHTSPVGSTITVPSDATLALVVISAYRNTANWIAGSTLTLGGESFTGVVNASTDNQTTYLQTYFAWLANPPTGSQAFSWTWAGANPEYGPVVRVLFFNGVDTANPIKDANRNQSGSASFTIGSLNAASGDYSLFALTNYNAYGTSTGGSQLAQQQYVNTYSTLRGGDGITSFSLTTGGSYVTAGALVISNQAGGPASPVSLFMAHYE